ncbi:MAG: hypothetical protein HY023_15480 [Chloroflexi bacterium]|nr:hypothetical protein [Chloroflexota bacterium]
MYLGNRNVRSAGRSSGSIEITLPTQLQVLEGVECHLMMRDGPRPEIVLQPDLSAAQVLFQSLWRKLRLRLGEIDDVGDFSLADFTLTFFRPRHWQERPPLAYADALRLLRQPAGKDSSEPEAMPYLLAYLAVAAGIRLGLKGALALAFGDAIAYLITGAPAGLGADFERGMAHKTFWGDGDRPPSPGLSLDDGTWRQARSGFRRVYEQFRAWQSDPEAYAAAREKWYRALSVEMAMWRPPEEWAARADDSDNL